MALTNEQKEVIRYVCERPYDSSDLQKITSFKGKPIKDIFPEAFEPELVDFSKEEIGDGLFDVALGAADEVGIPDGHGLFFSGERVKNPKITQTIRGGWVLTFEKK